MLRYLVVLLCIPGLVSTASAENYLLNGGQRSRIVYTLKQNIRPAAGTRILRLVYVVPVSFDSPTYRQDIRHVAFDFSPTPTREIRREDIRGNRVLEAIWMEPSRPVAVSVSLTAFNSVSLDPVKTTAPFPVVSIPGPVLVYTRASKMVDAGDDRIRRRAESLTGGAASQFDAVQRILSWVVDHMHYVLVPERYDALYSLETGRGNCQNYAHLAAALMRASGIPVRIVNGMTLKRPYDIRIGRRILTMRMAEGRHAWIEVFFPDLGWMPFDPSGTELFVSNRFIRVEVGTDNEETCQDGMMIWLHAAGAAGKPQYEESIEADFVEDSIALNGREADYGPRRMLLSPEVEASFARMSILPGKPEPETIPEKDLERLSYSLPCIVGNLDFPRNRDFLSVYGPVTRTGDGSVVSRKNFLVETAEYVTSRGRQYAQSFILKRPTLVRSVGLALHRFNGDGQLWLELYRDENGVPGRPVATSDYMDLKDIRYSPGYDWVNFSFTDTRLLLSPGRYWMALGFTGSPVVNWFFSYGKPVGPADGTRYRTVFDDEWQRSLSYEFNYRVLGMVAE